ncbi:MAG: hypothetical protein UV73_C0002G0014 [Candidatus Gottesmanbacteria bacterium GW2011_GWA2_43_14]|uniref:Uncharacterized protein n=1 Tax=Candidatus Gottesmanbacteria bacterium GW2011_GWA2_43_14 TaxID=1618443 RepID=A0A0G1DKC0_9BACT|nr:MAG: hypothetical protein UV73_C0002G0014 [Candidatus Gottesmanbacteria bacterium GW2011_GWA2_43_14]
MDIRPAIIQNNLSNLYQSIDKFNRLSPIDGTKTKNIGETYGQDRLIQGFETNLRFHGFTSLPQALRINKVEDSDLKGLEYEGAIIVYEERLKDESTRNFTFYNQKGPENIKATFNVLNMTNGENADGILTKDGKWFLRIITSSGDTYVLQVEQEIKR